MGNIFEGIQLPSDIHIIVVWAGRELINTPAAVLFSSRCQEIHPSVLPCGPSQFQSQGITSLIVAVHEQPDAAL